MAHVPTIRLEGISKSFGKVKANHNISLDIHKGRILALLGENGAGKSTLMSILAGQLQPDSGTILLDSEEVRFTSTDKAINAGIGMVYQHFKLVEAMTVMENVFLGKTGSFFLNTGKMNEEVTTLSSRYGMKLLPGMRISDLSMGEKQQVEILKLLHRKSSILIFDEPTAVLTPEEARGLFATMRLMADQGKAIVFISHKLDEVMSIADDIAILRRGEVVDTMKKTNVSSTSELAERMIGREVLLKVDRVPSEPRQMVLKVEKLNHATLQEISLTVRQGEILGLVGVAGNGQKPLVEVICGLQQPSIDSVYLLGLEWRRFYAARNWKNALSYIPEDRQGLATCQGLDLLDNFLLTTRDGFRSGIWLLREEAREKADNLLHEFDIRPPDLNILASQLSGGNLQKMVLCREFYRQPRLIVAEQPTQGLDIAAIEDVWKLLLKAREEAGILLVTGDLTEALTLSDRIAVMFGGKIVDCFSSANGEKLEQIPQMMAGTYRS
ncbi:ABC transporter ATP-binding protein [Desulfopila inferna]|uniref:ABC transporter ATP-binding protein n=1 Tax=Desulfopila inferna TaxID=468528 RepID=UPI001962A8B3|nr:ABC transporter ATP-binding protein [Desulfopila inferna]MBM9604977.1 ABC transporter ATP-binding protein [Desulfopila inferna]